MANNPGTPEARRVLDKEPWAYFIGRSTPNGSEKFWRIRRSMNYLETWWGRIGTVGQRNVKTYPDVRSATSAYAALRASKLSRGYRRQEGTPAIRSEATGLTPESSEWAAKYQGRFWSGTAQRIIDGVLSACTNRAQEQVVMVRVRTLVGLSGGRETVMSDRGSALGELVVSRAPGDGLLDVERELERQVERELERQERAVLRVSAATGMVAEALRSTARAYQEGALTEIAAHRTEAPQRPTNIQFAREPTAPFRPQVDPLTHRVAVYALRDVRNGGAVIHPRGFKQMLRSADAAEVVTGSLDYGYQHPDQAEGAMPEAERWLREQRPLTGDEIRVGVRRLRDFATEVTRMQAAEVARPVIAEAALLERQRWEADARAQAARTGLYALGEWQSELVNQGGAVVRLYYREIEPEDRRIAGIPWLTLNLWGEPEVPLRLRLCGRLLGVWEASFSGPKTREYKEASSRSLLSNAAASDFSAEGAAALAFHGLLSDAFERGYVPQTAVGPEAAVSARVRKETPKAAAHPQATVALARFAGINGDDEEEI